MDHRTTALLVAAAWFVPGTAGAADDYVGSAACAACHKKIAADYAKTAMGRAASPAAAHVRLAAADRISLASEKLQRTFEVYSENGRLYQSETGPEFRSAYEVQYALGSGVNGLSFIVRRGDHLFQAPLSYYSHAGSWALSPGYEFADYGFNRPIAAACIACHSGRPRPVSGRNGQFAEPPFQELSIGCESCHGPGREHIRRAGGAAAIVNPARLAPARAEDICMSCHQGGDTRVLAPGKSMLDFRPGQLLNDTVAIFKIPRSPGSAAEVDLLEHHESMHLSKCFRESAGKLNCITCHNPHASKPDYQAACVGCHKSGLPATHPPPGTAGCVSCHMPKRDVGFIAHSALTNHRIVRTPAQGLPGVAFTQTTEALPDLVHFNRTDGRPPLPAIVLMQAYGELMERHPPYVERFQAMLNQAAREMPDQPLVAAALGRRALRAGAPAEAIQFLTKAVARGSESSTTFEDLGEALSQAGRLEEAVKALQRGIELAPFTPVLHKSLALRYIELQRFEEARRSLARYVELFPEDDFVRGLWKQVSSGGRAPPAR